MPSAYMRRFPCPHAVVSSTSELPGVEWPRFHSSHGLWTTGDAATGDRRPINPAQARPAEACERPAETPKRVGTSHPRATPGGQQHIARPANSAYDDHPLVATCESLRTGRQVGCDPAFLKQRVIGTIEWGKPTFGRAPVASELRTGRHVTMPLAPRTIPRGWTQTQGIRTHVMSSTTCCLDIILRKWRSGRANARRQLQRGRTEDIGTNRGTKVWSVQASVPTRADHGQGCFCAHCWWRSRLPGLAECGSIQSTMPLIQYPLTIRPRHACRIS